VESTASDQKLHTLEIVMESFSQILEQLQSEANMNDLGNGDKILLLLRLTETIENIKDPDTIEGLKAVFKLLVQDLTTGKVQRTH
jgi:hypothetical protein